jgi:hypothetical protein
MLLLLLLLTGFNLSPDKFAGFPFVQSLSAPGGNLMMVKSEPHVDYSHFQFSSNASTPSPEVTFASIAFPQSPRVTRARGGAARR